MNHDTEPAGVAAVRQHLHETFRPWMNPPETSFYTPPPDPNPYAWVDDAVRIWVDHRDAARICTDVFGFGDDPFAQLQAELEELDPAPDLGIDLS